MLIQQQKITLSAYVGIYDIVVPKDHLLRQINDLIDFSFVYQELVNKYCHDNGRNAIDPIRMFKYLLLKQIYDISDEDVVGRSLYDMSFKYFLGMAPEEKVMNSSSLTKFRKLRLKDMDLLNLLIGKTVSIAIEKGIIKSNTIIVDATHTASRSNPYSPVQALKLRSKQLRKVLYEVDEKIKESLPAKNEDNDIEHEIEYTQLLVDKIASDEQLVNIPKISERLNMLRETLDDIQDHYTTSKDKDARVGHKTSESEFFGYKTHIAVTQERIITAAAITSGEKGDGEQLPNLVEQTEQNGMEVKEVLGDTAYSSDRNLKYAKEKDIKLISKLNPVISNGLRKEEDKWDYNKDADMIVCPAGHIAIKKTKHISNIANKNSTITYHFDYEKCKLCALKDICLKDGKTGKTYSVSIKTDTQTEQLAFQQTEEFKEKYRERYKIEAKNAELKNVLGYDRAISYGMTAMQLQGAMTMFVANLKRIITLLNATK